MKSIAVLLVTLILLQSVTFAAETSDALAEQAKSAYINGDYKTAASLFQQLANQGTKSAEIYFDLGNSYYQLHDLGHALINYRRAALSIPRDDDVRLNLARVRAQRVDGMMAEAGIAGQISAFTSDWFSSVELGWIVVVLLWLVCGTIATCLLRPDWRKWLQWIIAVFGTFLIIITALIVVRGIVDNVLKPAVVLNDRVSIMTGPGTGYLEIFELHAATEIRIVEERNHWIRFQLPDLREGWIEEQSVEII